VPQKRLSRIIRLPHSALQGQPVKMTQIKPKTAFSTGEAAHIAGVSHRTVDYWARTRLVVPSVAEATGAGITRLYDFKDLVALRVARELREAGISTQALRKALGCVKGVANPLAESRLLAIGSSVVWVGGREEIMDVLKRPGQRLFCFMLDFPRAVRETAEEAKINRAA
jgi:DNA-binding transcriptional MerR regulator